MPIPLPNLDDRTYAELTAEARALIPSVHPAWTDHNPSDPGIVLVELLAWLTEMLLFQVNEVPPASTRAFLHLLDSSETAPPPDLALDEAIRWTIRHLRQIYRAVTPEDYEQLALQAWPETDAARSMKEAGRIARVRCVPRRNMEATDAAVRAEPVPAHVSLVVVPAPRPGESHPEPTSALRTELSTFLDPCRMLTTRLHVVGPTYAEVGVAATLALRGDAPPATALDHARQALATFFDPLTGGPDGTGWPFGRDVYSSEVYAVLAQVPLVDYVEGVRITGLRPLTADGGEPVGVGLDADELVKITALDLVAFDASGEEQSEGVPS